MVAAVAKFTKKRNKTKKYLTEMEQLSGAISAVPEDPSEDLVLSDRRCVIIQKIVGQQVNYAMINLQRSKQRRYYSRFPRQQAH